ncbi:unnamed protein product [Parnassius apollo]|uniref:26S proteasome regulatory subunit 7 n=1 Tax=Parnassius apollo TaxID=110799 RepID=A0A8S3WYQ1_PARAO|nr:unnamed protein product [Parnassius apollo]
MPDHLGDDMRKVKDDKEEPEKEIKSLDEGDIALLKSYGQGQYTKIIKEVEDGIQTVMKRVNELTGIKESDTGLAPPALWDLAADKQTLQNEQPLQVARCTKIINADSNDPKYIINVKQFAKFVVDLADSVAPTDIEEGMRVGVDRNKYQIHIPLPPKIDPTVTMMQVEEKPDVTYSDVGGCKEQIEKLREVVETPLLHPEKFVKLGIEPPKGVLLFGPPGTGKTLCARAVANRTDACFIRVIGLKGKIRHTKQKNKSSLIQTQLRNFYERDDVSRLKTDIASKSLKENSHDRMKKCSKKRKIKDIHLKTNKKLKTEEESSTDEDMTISLHDTSDEEYHITDDILSDDDYLDHMDYQLKEQKNVTNLRKISDTSKIEREKIEQSSHEDKKNTYTGKDTREINIFSNENQGVVKTNLAEQSVIATTLQDDENNFDNAKNDSEVTSKINTDIWRLSFKDTVLVRYYQRTALKYYIGFLEYSFKKEGKSYFTIRFLKTIKKPELKFVIHKIKDEDTVTEDLIVKQVKITQNDQKNTF